MSLMAGSGATGATGATAHNGTRTPARASMQRSFTVPSKLCAPTRPPAPTVEIGAAKGIETLYVHPSAKVVSFATSGATSRPSTSAGGRAAAAEKDGLPWSNPTERTLAAGPLEIYRVPGSVSFLHSGSLLHAILPRSQCWCVDGRSVFAFRVLPHQYYRIELPGTTDEDLQLVEGLKATLAKVLYYERTACPFRREDRLPEMPEVPRRTKSISVVEPAKRWTFDRKWKPEGGGGGEGEGDGEGDRDSGEDARPNSIFEYESEVSNDNTTPEPEVTITDEQDEPPLLGVGAPYTNQLFAQRPPASIHPAGIQSTRSVTAPPQLSLHFSPPSKVEKIVGRIDQAVRTYDEARASTPTRRGRQASTSPLTLPPAPEPMHQDSPSQSDSGPQLHGESDDRISDEPVISRDFAAESQLNIALEQVHFTEPDAGTPQDVEQRNSEDEGPLEPPTPVASKRPPDTTSPATQEATEQQRTQPSPLPFPNFSKPRPIPSPSASPNDSAASSADSWTSLPSNPPGSLRQRIGLASASATSSASSSYKSLSNLSTSSMATLRQGLQKSVTSSDHTQRGVIKDTGSLLVRKTMTVFMTPPAYLVALMLRIAAKITKAGEGAIFSLPVPGDTAGEYGRFRGHRRIPGSFDLSDDEDDWGI